MKLSLELIPESSWGLSLAHILPKPVWDMLRRSVYREYSYCCAICLEGNTRVNCHETWAYDDLKRVQKLVGFQCLCDKCHNLKHWGRTVTLVHQGKMPVGYLKELEEHFCRVNKCTVEDFENHKVGMGDLFQMRSRHPYRVSFGIYQPDKLVKVWEKREKKRRNGE